MRRTISNFLHRVAEKIYPFRLPDLMDRIEYPIAGLYTLPKFYKIPEGQEFVKPEGQGLPKGQYLDLYAAVGDKWLEPDTQIIRLPNIRQTDDPLGPIIYMRVK